MGKKGKKAPEVCENCRWWEPMWDMGYCSYDPAGHKGRGWCNRYPPQVVVPEGMDPYEDPRSMLPEVGVNAWCGEFKAMKSPRRPA